MASNFGAPTRTETLSSDSPLFLKVIFLKKKHVFYRCNRRLSFVNQQNEKNEKLAKSGNRSMQKCAHWAADHFFNNGHFLNLFVIFVFFL